MKRNIYLLVTALVAMTLVSCEEKSAYPNPGDITLDSIPAVVLPDPTPDPEGVTIPDGTLNVYQARDTCAKLADGATTAVKYYVKGWVCSLDAKNADGIENYGNATFYIAATNDGQSDKFSFEAYQVYGKDGKKFVSVDQVKVGDFVIIYGKLTNFKGTAETEGKGAAYVYYSSNPNFDPKEDPSKITPDPEGADVPEGTINVYEARHISDSIGSGKTTSGEYYIKGWICKLDSKNAEGITGQYHNATFYISATNDGTTSGFNFEAYRVKGRSVSVANRLAATSTVSPRISRS